MSKKQELIEAYVRLFNTPDGEVVLQDLEDRAHKLIRVDQYPTETMPNPAYLNPQAALYKAGLLDQVMRIKRILAKAETQTYDDQEIHPDTQNIIRNLRSGRYDRD